MSVYDLLKPWQVYGDKNISRTHNGMEPTLGKWDVPEEDWGEVCHLLGDVEGKWAITEVSPAISNLIFDVDTYLSEDIDMLESGELFCRTLRNVLSSCTDCYAERGVESEMYLLTKPKGTCTKKGFKVGFKVVLPYERASVDMNKMIAGAMRAKIEEWMLLPALNDAKSIVDDSVYGVGKGWLMLGSTKMEQERGYFVAKGFRGVAMKPLEIGDEADMRYLLSRLIVQDDSRPLTVTAEIPAPTLKRKMEPRRASHTVTEAMSPTERAIYGMLKLVPQRVLDTHTEWIRLAMALKSGEEEENYNLYQIYLMISRRSIHYSDDAWLAEKWRGLKPREMKSQGVSARLLSLICEWKGADDLVLDRSFLFRVHEVLGSAEALSKSIEAEIAKGPGQTKKKKDAWLEKIGDFIMCKSDEVELTKSVHEYLGKFIAFVASDSKSEVVQMGYSEVQGTHVMSKFIRRLRKPFMDGMGGIAPLLQKYAQSELRADACGFTLDPTFQHTKDDERLRKSHGMQLFNTFCGFNVDKIISQEEARTFKYDEAKVEEVNELLGLLTNHDPEVLSFMQKWMALPLQQRGRRTNFMPIIRSDKKGNGKSLFFGGFLGGRIYGGKQLLDPHFKASYRQIQDINHVVGEFNEGLMGSIYLELDECGIFDGATKQNEKLKSLITEDTVAVNQKNMSLAYMPNHINMCLATNKTDPISIKAGDRRFVEIEVLGKRDKRYYTDLAGKLLHCDSYVKSYYAYLMQLPGAEEITLLAEPPMTREKRETMVRNVKPACKFLQALVRAFRICNDLPDDGSGDESLETEAFCIMSRHLTELYERWTKGPCGNILMDIRSLIGTSSVRKREGGSQGRAVCFPCCRDIQAALENSSAWDYHFQRDIDDAVFFVKN